MRVKLFTRAGEFVHEDITPPFNEPPDVLFWGTRVFVRAHEGYPAPGEVTYFLEAFAYYLSTVPQKPEPPPLRTLTEGSDD